MKKYNPNIHHRRSMRLKGYDYAREGLYYITICCQDRARLFGDVIDGQSKLNDAGRMVEKWYFELENKFPNIKCHAMIVMPDHFHCILETVGTVGAELRVGSYCTDNAPSLNNDSLSNNSELPNNVLSPNDMASTKIAGGEHGGSPLYHVVQWFKTMTTNEYIRGVKFFDWKPFNGKLWQRNYYDHIIRNTQSYHRISKYIIDNPAKWMDKKPSKD